MTAEQLKSKIKLSIQAFNNADSLSDISIQLFESLGYNTDRKAKSHKPDFKEFKDNFIENKIFDNKKAKSNEWKYVDLLFQLTKEEVINQNSLFNNKKVDNTVIEAYLFFVIELNNKIYTKGELSLITREVNRLFPMPAMILFKHGSSLTLSVINRRLHKRDESKDVLEKVTLIKDININEPHRAHIEILFDLSFEKLKEKFNFSNFVELHNAWQKTLDTKELNKKFYEKLFNWYLWALKHVKFPQIRAEEDMLKDEIHQSESLIRLLTRMLFVWFMKEKGLINPVLFDSKKLKNILKNFDDGNGEETIYYKAILQNLFFATLNKPIEKRKVIDKGYNRKEYGDPLVYRFDELFIEPKYFIKLFENIPFLNGGLFECLDRKKDNDNPVEIRLDGFSTTKYKQPIIPDKLFFGEYKNVDLSEDYFDKKKNKQTVFGLIDILNQYKFTIEENTPIEEEIALDPELLGKVFENLLASYNPETKTTARKQTGSFYTPREIVNYMVDESIIAYLKNHIDDEERLRQLLSYNKSETENPFNEKETLTLLKAIDNCKILDPACGSGAFPMGILQKMIFILHKLDPENKLWFDMVIENIPAYMRDEFRKRLKKESWNYVRKLGIIQQCIYGVDIQPIATQIAKLRFFISLLVDQQDKPNEYNRGFEPLPNLDFKIVTANTLISAPASDVKSEGLFENQQDPFFEQFDKLTEQYFTASIEEDKKKLRKAITALINKKCEEKIEEIEKSIAAEDERVKKALKEKKKDFIAAKENEIKLWQSYPNIFKHESVGFFEPRYFFPKVKDGFDIVIGNPPYGASYSDTDKEYFKQNYFSAQTKNGLKGSLDTFSLFIERSFINMNNNSFLSFIVPLAVTSSDSMSGLHKLLYDNCEVIKISSYFDRPKKIFDNAEQSVSIIQLNKNCKKTRMLLTTKVNKRYYKTTIQELIDEIEFVNSQQFVKYGRIPKIGNKIEKNILNKLFLIPIRIHELINSNGSPIFYRTTGGRYYKIITNFSTGSSKENSIFVEKENRDIIAAVLSSNLYYWFYHIYSNTLDLKFYELEIFPLPIETLLNKKKELENLYNNYLIDLHKNSKVKNGKYAHVKEYREYYARKSKHIIDKIDLAIQDAYGLTDEEINFIINYDLKFRTDDE